MTHVVSSNRRPVQHLGHLAAWALLILLLLSPLVTNGVSAHGDFAGVRINAGGTSQTVNGVGWLACPTQSSCNGYVSGGFSVTPQPITAIAPVVSPANSAIYQSEWTGGSTTGIPAGGVAFAFNIPLPNDEYIIRLHFAELVQNSAGRRVFDVRLEGTTVLTSFDIFQQAGGMHKGIVREFRSTLTDSVLNIEFIRQVQNAKISGIEILPVHDATPTPPPPPATNQPALLVVGNTTLSSADAKVKARLEGLGLAVTVIKDSSTTPASADGKALVVVSSTVLSGNVYTKLRNTTAAVMNWDPYLNDDFGMVGSTFGNILNQKQVTIASSGHPLAAGLSGTVTTNTVATEFSWGQPGANAVVIAHVANDASKPVIFGYAKGSQMVGLTAPGNRVGFFMGNTTPDSLTTQGWQLFDAAVNWLLGGSSTPTPPPPTASIVWTEKAPNSEFRMEAMGIAHNNRLYTFGGYTYWPNATTSAAYYNPDTNTWTAIAPMPEAVTHAPVVVDGNKIYLIGGFVGAYPSPSTGRVWIYDIVANSWSAGPSLPQPVGAGAAAVVGRNLYFFGGTIRTTGATSGFSDQTASYVLNLDGGTGWQSIAPIPTPRNHMAAAAYDGRIYVFGGQLGGDEGGGNQSIVEMYNPATNTWSPRTNMPVGKGHIAVFQHSTFIYVVGGTVNDGVYGAASDGILRYSPATNSWTTLPPLPLPLKQPVAAIINNRLYVATGQNGSPTNRLWEGVFTP